MEKMIIDVQSGKLNMVDDDRMETLPMGTVLYCTADELRALADLMDKPSSTVDEIRKAAINTKSPSKRPAKRG